MTLPVRAPGEKRQVSTPKENCGRMSFEEWALALVLRKLFDSAPVSLRCVVPKEATNTSSFPKVFRQKTVFACV